MAISRSLMNRQLRANGGIMDITPRENFGLGSSLKKFVRKIIPNEVADIAVKAAPFVAPFNPALAGVMSGVGTFDQTGSISAGLKSGAMNYGMGQASRYIGGADFQGNPFGDGGAFTGGLQGFKGGFSSPLGTETGLGKFFSNRGTQGVQGIDMATGGADGVGVIQDAATSNVDMITGGADGVGIIQDTIIDKSVVTKEPGFLKNMFDGISNQDYGKVAKTIGDGAKKFGKAMFTNKDGSIDKAAVMGAIAFAGSYAEALALAEDAGVEITEEAYDEARKVEKQEEYAGYLTNFFGGQKDGGRIGYEGGANELIMEKLTEDIMQDTSTEDMIMIMTDDGPKMIKRSDYEAMPGMFRDTTTSLYGDAARGRPVPEFAKGGRIGYKDGTIILAEDELAEMGGEQGLKLKLLAEKFMEDGMSESDAYAKAADSLYAKGGRVNRRLGSPEEGEGSGLMEMLSVEVDAGGDEEENMLMAYTPGFSSQEKSYLFRRMGASGGAERSYTMPQLYRILKNPGDYPEDAAVLKEIAVMGLGKKDGGRINYKNGANRVSELLILRDEAVSKGEDTSIFDAEIFQLTGKTFKSIGGISDIPTGEPRLNAGGVAERDYRQTGGFVPVGIKERADDVPAMLSKNEFVMTADAVRGIGNGSVEEGSKKLYNTMKQAEQVGKA